MIEEIKKLHQDLPLSGLNSLEPLPPELLSYFLGLLRNQAQNTPTLSKEQWQQLLPAINSLGLTALFYWQVNQLPEDKKPGQDILETLRQSFMSQNVQLIRKEQQLKTVLQAFKQNQVDIIVLKGPAFARLAYPNPALRTYGDFDLLIKPEDIKPARKSLESLDYKCHSKIFENFKHLEIEEVYTKRSSITVELHWGLHAFYGIINDVPISQYFERAVKVSAENFEFYCLCPVDALIHAAIHMTMNHNQGIRLNWIYDIAMLAKQLTTKEDWQTLATRSCNMGVRIAVEKSLGLAGFWTGVKPLIPLNWPPITAKEQQNWQNTILRHDDKKSWFKVRWPKRLNPIGQVKLLAYLFADRLGINTRR